MATLPLSLVQQITSSEQGFGNVLAISGDGNIIAVGCVFYDAPSYTNTGAVFIYERSGGTYSLRDTINPPSLITSYRFGAEVSLNYDGSILAVSSDRGDLGGGLWYAGEVLIMTWSGSAWSVRDTIPNAVNTEMELWGTSVSLDSTGTKLIIGSAYDPSSDPYDGDRDMWGRVYTYTYNGSTWSSAAPNLDPEVGLSTTSEPYFGARTALSSNGLVLAVAHGCFTTPKTDYLPVFIYDWTGSTWSHRYTIQRSVYNKNYSRSLGLSSDGSTLYVGDKYSTEFIGGNIFVYSLGASSETLLGEYLQDGSITLSDNFATSLDISDTDLIVAGLPGYGPPMAVQVLVPPIYGTADIDLFTAVGAGVSEVVTASGAAQLTMSAGATGAIYSQLYATLNTEFVLPIGNYETVSYLDAENTLEAFVEYTDHLSAEYSVGGNQYYAGRNTFTYDLDSFTTVQSSIDQGYSLQALQLVRSYLEPVYGLLAFTEVSGKLLAEYNLVAPYLQQASLNNQYSLNTLKRVKAFIQGRYTLSAFTSKHSYLEAEYEERIARWRKAVADGEYSVSRYLIGHTELDLNYAVGAFTSITSQLSTEYNLDVLGAIRAFIDLTYQLDATTAYTAFVSNLETQAMSEYDNFHFNSISADLAANETGIYQLTGADDATADINATLCSGQLDFGSNQLKRITDAYLGVNSDGDVTLTVTTESDETVYTLTGTSDLDTVKANLGRGAKGRYWQLKIENALGSTLTLDSIDLLPQILTRRR